MMKLKYLAYLLIPLTLSAEANIFGKFVGKVGTGLIGGVTGAAIAKNQQPSVEQVISETVNLLNKTYTFPIKQGEFSSLVSIKQMDRTVVFTYVFSIDFSTLDLNDRKELGSLLKADLEKDIYNIHNSLCHNKALYDNLLARGALLRYEFYSADNNLLQAKTSSISDCRF